MPEEAAASPKDAWDIGLKISSKLRALEFLFTGHANCKESECLETDAYWGLAYLMRDLADEMDSLHSILANANSPTSTAADASSRNPAT